MSSIIDRINALETDSNVGLMVNKDAVLEIVKDAIAFEIEPHGDDRDQPDDEGARITWATLDTALRVIVTGAVKANLYALREAVGVEGVITDDEAIAQASAQLGFSATLAHVGASSEVVGQYLMQAFNEAVDATCDKIADSIERGDR